MTHYLIMTQMPQLALEHMLDDLERLQKFPMDKGFEMDNDLCICEDYAKANVREIRFFEIDVATPATEGFEKWLGREGFQDLSLGNNNRLQYDFLHNRLSFADKIKISLRQFIIKLGMGIFYKISDAIMGYTAAPFKSLYDNTGTKYFPFSPMSRRFKEELPKSYDTKYQSQANQRNIVIGKMIEYPIGSFTLRPCKRCGANYAGAD